MKRRKRKHTGPTKRKVKRLPMLSKSDFTPKDGSQFAFDNVKAVRGYQGKWGVT